LDHRASKEWIHPLSGQGFTWCFLLRQPNLQMLQCTCSRSQIKENETIFPVNPCQLQGIALIIFFSIPQASTKIKSAEEESTL